MSDSKISHFTPKAEPGTEEYKSKVAVPVMRAVDGMPKSFRDLCHRLGYIQVYLAWKKGITVQQIEQKAVGDWFEL